VNDQLLVRGPEPEPRRQPRLRSILHLHRMRMKQIPVAVDHTPGSNRPTTSVFFTPFSRPRCSLTTTNAAARVDTTRTKGSIFAGGTVDGSGLLVDDWWVTCRTRTIEGSFSFACVVEGGGGGREEGDDGDQFIVGEEEEGEEWSVGGWSQSRSQSQWREGDSTGRLDGGRRKGDGGCPSASGSRTPCASQAEAAAMACTLRLLLFLSCFVCCGLCPTQFCVSACLLRPATAGEAMQWMQG
jgi:hypothetical protein